MNNPFKIEINQSRIFGLDLLRAMAILFVLICHAELQLPKILQDLSKLFYFDGVLIFFVLSGYLIGNIFIKQFNNNDFSKSLVLNFWKRRWLRTLPAYLFTLILLIVICKFSNPNFPIEKTWRYFFFLQNINTKEHLFFFGESWSLTVEEWFYLLMPILTLSIHFIFRLNFKKSILLYIGLTIIGMFVIRHIKYIIYNPQDIRDWADYFKDSVNTRLDSISFGVLGAYLNYYYKDKWLKLNHFKYMMIGLISFFVIRYLVLFGFIERGSYFNCNIAFALNSLLIFITLPFFSNMKETKSKLFNNAITKISLISYSMYLLNLSVITYSFINRLNIISYVGDYKLSVVINYSLFWILTILCSILMYKYIEIPFMKLRDRK
ncbi:peptidoglycan/LPS O-acetylase OafA/YrhL [Dysgonomonas sp. PFB1-18]|uniref:acyltransferase family protein n=1 Tax=unclassified Dysgonomonas TaxID=2630389 RepID=UPI0024735366|nr:MULTISPECIES: acyltransferase [unclassified Dysgonomonas]MDH6309416.1 peptidoglycan/LPS O-acetylase OafA/YrhL [Dysgonomonas sp. PF1-14]MDH6339719.1 peptidoglycan/LPS O-acetylase OafA/YrhL [Dysgonomonas sp. PF1-16]MDH6381367.1 peptidoglycan/LPS O-acetylase OafA/YrhL [Dysgonomonas sp. PFB1-18]MDH6398582.1 peptidoglycan/LPS O-acetylase OafA/YrhL [Dysgonomonas sp. PF1-23]